jgi:hypothetical protein
METNQNGLSDSRSAEPDPQRALQPPGQPGAALPVASTASTASTASVDPPPRFQADFTPVPVRYRHDGWTPERQRRYVEELADTLSPAIAAARVGMTEQSVNRLRRRSGAEGFSAACDAAMAFGLRHQAGALLVDRALNGTIVRRYYHGQLVAEERVHSDRLLLFLVQKGEKLFGSSGETSQLLSDWDGWMERLESGALEGGWRVWRDRQGNRMTNYPPPRGFASYSEGEPGEPDYCRCLTEAEEIALEGKAKAKLEQGAKARDSFFGFTPGRRQIDRESRL